MDRVLFSALAEPSRLRIVDLLHGAPRSVGEIATELGLRQPQATKHLQTLERAGLVAVHPLGQRRIYALRRERFRELSRWLEPFASADPSEDTLERYREAIEHERSRAARDPQWAVGRTIRLTRVLAAPASEVWAQWTDPALLRRWWRPEHFRVAACKLDPTVDGVVRVVWEEGDGRRYVASGHVLAVAPTQRLRFELSHLAADGSPLFTAVHDVRLEARGSRTQLILAIRVIAATPAGVTALAGMRIAWEQMLDALRGVLVAAGAP